MGTDKQKSGKNKEYLFLYEEYLFLYGATEGSKFAITALMSQIKID